MPSQKINKCNELKNYFRVQSCANNEQIIFQDEADYRFFLSVFDKYFSKDNLSLIEIIAYCLASNVFDIFLCQQDDGEVAKFVHNIVIAYNKYYYNKYQVKDLLSEADLKISKALPDNLLDISRHIHTNPDDWMDYPYSSIRAYLYDDVPSWLNKTHIAEKFGSAVDYLDFLQIDR